MKVSRIRMLRGPNLWSRHTALEAIVDCDLLERAIDQLPAFEVKLRERFPQLGFMRFSGKTEVVSLAQPASEVAAIAATRAAAPIFQARRDSIFN